MKKLIDKLYKTNYLAKDEIVCLLDNIDEQGKEYLFSLAHDTLLRTYGNRIFIRGLLEFTNYCRNNCKYCGIRRDNKNVSRYRLSREEILTSLEEGAELGYKTFVLQGGEDLYYTDKMLEEIIKEIKVRYPLAVVTLSIGERSSESYEKYYNAGADRFLLRHETATPSIYHSLHPEMSFENRKKCLFSLKRIGYQTGAGFLVGLPGETSETLANNLLFLKELDPEMVGIGPLIPHPETPLKDEKIGSVETTLIMLAMTRLLLPEALIPATTALNTLCEEGIERGIKAGANVVMLNLSPVNVRKKYEIYRNKESRDIHELDIIKQKAANVGFVVDMCRGDKLGFQINNNRGSQNV